MQKLKREDLLSLEDYSEKRSESRAKVLAHKRTRTLGLGAHVTLLFEDRLTIQYQVQEMLRIERIFERVAIEEELAAYNPLIPDGTNWKATMLIEYPDAVERGSALEQLKGIEHAVWVSIGGGSRIAAVADEDMARGDENKTSAVHFLRFELDRKSIAAVRSGARIAFGVSHPAYQAEICPLPSEVRRSLVADLDSG